MPIHALQSLLDQLRAQPARAVGRAYVGFDGYVDKIQKVVRAKSATERHYVSDIGELAGLVGALAGKSGQIELVTLVTKIGGNAPIMAHALASLGVQTRCVGTLTDAVFAEMHPLTERISLGPPAESNALEFADGKVILSEVSSFERLRWSNVVAELGLDRLRQHYADSQLLAFVDWANLPHGTQLWAGYLTDVVAPAGATTLPRHFLFDLCDPTKRSADEVRAVLDVVRHYVPYGHVTLGMNENEARRLYLALHGHSPADTARLAQTPDLPVVARYIQAETAIPNVVVHPTDGALLATDAGLLTVAGRLVPEPKVLTGGGDNLNAGYGWGLLHGFAPADCLRLGIATSGAYIQNGQSPALADVVAYVETWLTEMSLRSAATT